MFPLTVTRGSVKGDLRSGRLSAMFSVTRGTPADRSTAVRARWARWRRAPAPGRASGTLPGRPDRRRPGRPARSSSPGSACSGWSLPPCPTRRGIRDNGPMPSVLLIHGGLWEDAGADWFWRRTGVIDGLAARGFTVIAPDRLRRAPSWTAEASHIASAPDLPDEPLTVVGGSFGCAVAAR